MNIPSNIFMPNNLFERVISTNNLSVLGNNKVTITGGGISFNDQEAKILAFGEFAERYSSSFQLDKGLVFGSYQDLVKVYKCFDPVNIRYFTEQQYADEKFELKRLDYDTKTHWIKCRDFLADQEILMPFFMTNVENVIGDGKFHINTTTGTACHTSIQKVIESGLLECIERDAFCKFWYLQKIKKYRKFTSDFILKQYADDKWINALFYNKKVEIFSFDISELAYCPTFVTFLYFKKKNKTYQSVGSASRLDHKEALIKSSIEAYQGIEYVELVCKQNIFDPDEVKTLNFKTVDSFRRHYALYNVHPELMVQVPLLREMFNNDISEEWQDKYSHHLKEINKEELRRIGLEEVYFTDLTTVDVKQFGLQIVKVVTPKLHLLTGDFLYPYLGLFETGLDLMTEMPHPFP